MQTHKKCTRSIAEFQLFFHVSMDCNGLKPFERYGSIARCTRVSLAVVAVTCLLVGGWVLGRKVLSLLRALD